MVVELAVVSGGRRGEGLREVVLALAGGLRLGGSGSIRTRRGCWRRGCGLCMRMRMWWW